MRRTESLSSSWSVRFCVQWFYTNKHLEFHVFVVTCQPSIILWFSYFRDPLTQRSNEIRVIIDSSMLLFIYTLSIVPQRLATVASNRSISVRFRTWGGSSDRSQTDMVEEVNWKISQEERIRHDALFYSQKPRDGFLSGARYCNRNLVVLLLN